MEILRVPPYDTTVDIQVDEASTDYPVIIRDMADLSITTFTQTSDSDGVLNIDLPSRYDGEYEVEIYDEEHYYYVVRPYVDPNTKADTASAIEEYRKNEEIARAIIDSVIAEGFYFKKKVIETTGLGTDYIPLWVDAKRVLAVYENNTLIYDAAHPENYERAFEITKDKTAIVQSYADTVDRAESAPLIMPTASSDIASLQYGDVSFPKNSDYTIVLEVGYKNIPSDIVRATELLVDDLSCGKLDYFKRYATSYNTDQFKIQFDSAMFGGTGNIVVDKILSKYAKSIRSIGVL